MLHPRFLARPRLIGAGMGTLLTTVKWDVGLWELPGFGPGMAQ